MDIQDFFLIGMDRGIRPLLPNLAPQINLGGGKKVLPGEVQYITKSHWDAEKDELPVADGSVGTIWALHFLEHIQNLPFVLSECQRVLKPSGTINICVPYGTCHMAVQDPDHKRFFNEDTWRHLFANPYYDSTGRDWRLGVHVNYIMGIKGENLALFTQLYKMRDPDAG